MSLQRVYEQYKDQADFWWVYIREAHASDSSWPARHVSIEQPKTFEKREEVAASCSAALNLKIPVLVDDMQDTVNKAYSAWPDRLFIIGADAKLIFSGEPGPRGFRVDAMEEALKKALQKK